MRQSSVSPLIKIVLHDFSLCGHFYSSTLPCKMRTAVLPRKHVQFLRTQQDMRILQNSRYLLLLKQTGSGGVGDYLVVTHSFLGLLVLACQLTSFLGRAECHWGVPEKPLSVDTGCRAPPVTEHSMLPVCASLHINGQLVCGGFSNDMNSL